MSPRERTASPRRNGATDEATSSADALQRAEEAEAEAAEAQAVADAARARARAIRLRQHAWSVTSASAKPDADSAADAEADDVFEAEPFTDTEQRPSTLRRRIRRLRWRPVVAVVALLVIGGFSTVGVLMYVHHQSVVRHQQARADFAAAAKQGVISLMSLNFANAKDDVARIIDNSTGAFKQDFQASADEFAEVAQGSQVVTQADVHAVAVESMTDDTAVVLVAVSSRVTNKEGAADSLREWRLSVDMARDGGRIKMAKVEFVP